VQIFYKNQNGGIFFIGENMERDVQLEDMPKMRYAEQCIRETMRLLPTVPIIGRVITEETQIGQPKNWELNDIN
jgi:cytochrome P450